MKQLFTLLLIPSAVFASEYNTSCNLTRARAEIDASVLGSPFVQAQVGQDPSSGTKSASVGVGQSYSGYKRAQTIRDAADASCSALYATLQLEQVKSYRLLFIQQAGAHTEVVALDDAFNHQQALIEQLTKQVNAGVSTLPQLLEARSQLSSIQTRQAELHRILDQRLPTLDPGIVSIRALVEQARKGQTDAARLAAKSSAMAAWDVSVAVGLRQPLGGVNNSSQSQSVQPFVGITGRYSFGANAASQAADNVGHLTNQLFSQQTSGYQQTLERLSSEVSSRIVTEETLQDNTSADMTLLEQSISLLSKVDSVQANTLREQLRIQQDVKRAILVGSKQRSMLLVEVEQQLSQ